MNLQFRISYFEWLGFRPFLIFLPKIKREEIRKTFYYRSPCYIERQFMKFLLPPPWSQRSSCPWNPCSQWSRSQNNPHNSISESLQKSIDERCENDFLGVFEFKLIYNQRNIAFLKQLLKVKGTDFLTAWNGSCRYLCKNHNILFRNRGENI